MVESNHGTAPQLPIAISAIEDRYMIFDIEAITWLRKVHNICGVFIGTLPQNPSQNVFMGLPMEIMPEEAQVLINTGIGFILEDAKAHDMAMAKANRARQQQYIAEVTEHADAIAREKALEKQQESQIARERQARKKSKQTQQSDSVDASTDNVSLPSPQVPDTATLTNPDDITDSLFDSTATITPSTPLHPHNTTITPTTSSSLLQTHSSSHHPHSPLFLPGQTPKSYSLYNHLHSLPGRTYFMTPGLRFGCQFCVYPGDPLRFHSHFLATGVDWDEEIDLMDIVGGGRLGTGVKKGYLFGGKSPEPEGRMRVFSVEWAAM